MVQVLLGDTTTTLIWIYGRYPSVLAHAFIPVIAAFLVLAFFGARQHRYTQDIFVPEGGVKVENRRIALVVLILAGAIIFNYFFEFPALGIWLAILIGTPFVKINFREA